MYPAQCWHLHSQPSPKLPITSGRAKGQFLPPPPPPISLLYFLILLYFQKLPVSAVWPGEDHSTFLASAMKC